MAQLGEDVENALKAVSYQSLDEAAQMLKVFEVQLTKSLKHLQACFRLKNAKVSHEMKKAL